MSVAIDGRRRGAAIRETSQDGGGASDPPWRLGPDTVVHGGDRGMPGRPAPRERPGDGLNLRTAATHVLAFQAVRARRWSVPVRKTDKYAFWSQVVLKQDRYQLQQFGDEAPSRLTVNAPGPVSGTDLPFRADAAR